MRVSGINDYSFLFNQYSNTSRGSSDLLGSINLTDYKNIKTGGYGKLLKSYYSMEKVDSKETTSSVSSNETKKVAHKTNFLDSIVPMTDTTKPEALKDDETKSDTAKEDVATKVAETTGVKKQEEIPVADTSKLLYSMNAGYADASSVLAGNFFNVGA